jgi:dihydropteroate synthase
MAEVVNERKTAVILMHSRGNRDALHSQSPMVSPAEEIMKDLEKAARQVINRAAVVLDPGIGFGKRAEESLSVLRKIQAFSQLEYPLLVGTSRKSFIRKVVADRLWGTAATIAYSILNGVHIVRVHDVREIRALVDTLDVLNEC